MTDIRQRVLPSIQTRTETDCRHALARDLIRICHEHGPQRVGLTVGCDEKTIRNARDEAATLKLHTAMNLLVIDPGAFDGLMAEFGKRVVDMDVAETGRHATATVSRLVPHLAEAQDPHSESGPEISMAELFQMESDLRASHRVTGALLARIDAKRGVGRAA